MADNIFNYEYTFESEHTEDSANWYIGRVNFEGTYDVANNCSYWNIYVYAKLAKYGDEPFGEFGIYMDNYFKWPDQTHYQKVTIYGNLDGVNSGRLTNDDWFLVGSYLNRGKINHDGSKRIILNSITQIETPGGEEWNSYGSIGYPSYEVASFNGGNFLNSTVTATHANIGEETNIAIINSQGSGLTHDVFYSLDGGVTLVQLGDAKRTDRRFTWTVPYEFYEQIPTEKRGTIGIYVDTYNEAGDKIGDRNYTTFWAYAVESDCGPILNPIIEDRGSYTSLTGDDSKLISGYSDAYYKVNATAQRGATIVDIQVINGSRALYTATGTFEKVVTNDFTFYVRDSRGYSATQALIPDMIYYTTLTCNVDSTAPTTAGDMEATISGNYFNESFGYTRNTLTVKYRLAVDGTYGSWITVTPTLSSNTYSVTVPFTGLDYQKTYAIEAYAVDKLKTVYSAEKVINALPIFDWSKDDFRVNVPTIINGDVIINGKLTNNDLELVGNTGVYYGTCSTTGNVETKVVECPTFAVLIAGASVRVKFDYGNSIISIPLLDVNGTGGKPIAKYGSYGDMEYAWRAGEVKDFVYDGQYWVMVDGGVATVNEWGRTMLSDTIIDDNTVALTPSALYELAIESGTWEPTLGAPAAVSSYNTRQGWYQKIGNCVTIGFNVSVVTKSGYHGTVVEITGVPYTPSYSAFGGGVAYNVYTPANQIFEGWTIDTSGTITARTQTENKTTASNLSIGSNVYYAYNGANMTIAGTICYMTN